ncbi:helix-turn-helix domain-containing protein [Flavobacteriaceae bacterium Ap0902]|nr:helix-turn-helix domain-containing protein [Flavobacteriaceae bacterium Ap0902]
MTNKEKFLKRIAGQESKALQQAKWRNANREWLKESHKLALKILMALDEKNMNQKDLAEATGKSPQYINKLLKGNEKFGFEILVKIQNTLNIGLLSTFEPTARIKEFVVEEKLKMQRFHASTDYTDCKVIRLKNNYIKTETDTYLEA